MAETHRQIMIRPRVGSFVYSPQEVGTMLKDIAVFKAEGVKGFVFGCLRQDGQIDVASMRRYFRREGSLLTEPRLAEAAKPFQSKILCHGIAETIVSHLPPSF